MVPRHQTAPGLAPLRQEDREYLEFLKRTYAEKASDQEFAHFVDTARSIGLSPQAKQIYAVSRYSERNKRYEMTLQIGIDGYRVLAARSGQIEAIGEALWCGPDGQWTDIWLAKTPPVAAKIPVWRRGAAHPTWGKAHYEEYVQRDKNGNLQGQWRTMPANQLAIAAERAALRRLGIHDITVAEERAERARVVLDGEVALGELPWAPEDAPPPERPEPRGTAPALVEGPAAPSRPAAPEAPRLTTPTGDSVAVQASPKQLDSIRAHLARTGIAEAGVLEECAVAALDELDTTTAAGLLRDLAKRPNADPKAAAAAADAPAEAF
jgi:hypothetical protein